MQHMVLPNHLGFTGLCAVKPIYSHKAVVKESVVFITQCQARSQACVHAKSLQMFLTLSDPMDCSLPGSSVHPISQARILEWVSVSSSRESSCSRNQTWVSCIAGSFFITEPSGKPKLFKHLVLKKHS